MTAKTLIEEVPSKQKRTTNPRRELLTQTITDKPGEFAWINTNELHIDENYQRGAKPEKVKQMAATWSWVACGAISVALRDDATWFVMDGQHRVKGARLRGIEKMPCIVFDLNDVAEEARGFLRSNTARRPVTMVDRHKAMLMTEDHTARVANELVLSSGRTVASGPGWKLFGAMAQLLRCIQTDEAVARRMWQIATLLCQEKKITVSILAGLFYLEQHLLEGASLSQTHWRNRLCNVGYEAINESINRTVALYGIRNDKNAAFGIALAINKGLRKQLQHDIEPGKPT